MKGLSTLVVPVLHNREDVRKLVAQDQQLKELQLLNASLDELIKTLTAERDALCEENAKLSYLLEQLLKSGGYNGS